MKTITLLSLSFILSVLSVTSAPTSVLDVTGKTYRQAGRGQLLYHTSGSKQQWWLNCTEPNWPTQNLPSWNYQLQAKKHGLLLTFNPVNPKKHVIRLSTDANINFSGPTSCNESNLWRLKYDEAIQQYFVTVGSVMGGFGPAHHQQPSRAQPTKGH